MKVMEVEGKRIVAVCDSELLGKKFQEGDYILDLDSSRNFYEGKKSEPKEVLNAMGMADSINLVGSASVAIGIDAGVVEERNLIKVEGVPHAQVYRLE